MVSSFFPASSSSPSSLFSAAVHSAAAGSIRHAYSVSQLVYNPWPWSLVTRTALGAHTTRVLLLQFHMLTVSIIMLH
jgi:hypothetical protein